jgi:predicted O-methyltransferase YrrM
MDGEMAELGVFKGGSARMFAKTVPNKILHLFDTFEGIPEADERYDKKNEDGKLRHIGAFRGKDLFNRVQETLSDCPNVRFHKGVFPGTTKGLKKRRFAFVHIDADVYPPTKAACEFFYPRMNRGGVMLFDDYHFGLTPGVTIAIDNFFADKKESVCLVRGCQGIVIKTQN